MAQGISGLGQMVPVNQELVDQYGIELAQNEYNSPEIMNAESDESRPTYYNGVRVTQDEIMSAQNSLQALQQQLNAERQQLAARPTSGWDSWSPEAKMQFFAGFADPSKSVTGGFAEGLSNAMSSAAPIVSRDRQERQSQIGKMDQLRVRAAELEQRRINDERKMQIDQKNRDLKRRDYLAKNNISLDAKGNPIPNEKSTSKKGKVGNGLLDTTTASQVRKQYGAAKMVLPQLNWMIDKLENGEIDETAFGAFAVPGEMYNATAGQVTGVINPKDLAFRNSLGLIGEQMKKAMSRDGSGRMSDQESKEVKKYVPSTGVFESRDAALIKLKTARDNIYNSAKTRLEDLQDEELMAEFEAAANAIADTNDLIPENIDTVKSNDNPGGFPRRDDKKSEPVVLFPLKVYKDGQEATVSSKEELEDAAGKGWVAQ